MITDGLHAFVLHKRWSGDTSAQVTFFTREKGVVSAMFKGGRTPKKQTLIQPFTPLWLTLDARRDWHYVRHLDVLAPSLTLAGDALFAGLYVNEIIYHGVQQLDPVPMIYDAFIQTLQSLTQTPQRMEIEALLRRFEWQFLISCGYPFSFANDARTGMPVVPDYQYDFIAGEGFVQTIRGVPGAHIIAMAHDQLEEPGVLKSAKWIMRRAIDHALDGKRIMARELYQQGQAKTVTLSRT